MPGALFARPLVSLNTLIAWSDVARIEGKRIVARDRRERLDVKLPHPKIGPARGASRPPRSTPRQPALLSNESTTLLGADPP
jgi:hypothetical protein